MPRDDASPQVVVRCIRTDSNVSALSDAAGESGLVKTHSSVSSITSGGGGDSSSRWTRMSPIPMFLDAKAGLGPSAFNLLMGRYSTARGTGLNAGNNIRTE